MDTQQAIIALGTVVDTATRKGREAGDGLHRLP